MAIQRQNSQGLVSTMPGRVSAVRSVSAVRNDYRCSIERNQGGKYCVRIRVRYPRLARRIEFPPKAANLALAPERNIPAFALGSVRRGLAESMEGPRPVYADAST